MEQENWRSRAFEMVMLQRDTGAGDEMIQMFHFFDTGKDMILDGFG